MIISVELFEGNNKDTKYLTLEILLIIRTVCWCGFESLWILFFSERVLMKGALSSDTGYLKLTPFLCQFYLNLWSQVSFGNKSCPHSVTSDCQLVTLSFPQTVLGSHVVKHCHDRGCPAMCDVYWDLGDQRSRVEEVHLGAESVVCSAWPFAGLYINIHPALHTEMWHEN